MSKPTIVFVPGAWHVPKHYEIITSYLEKQGYPVICNQNTSTGADSPANDNVSDAAAIRKTIDSVLGDVIVAMHSYGGQPGPEAAVGAKNVIGLIFIAAFVIGPGVSVNRTIFNGAEEPPPGAPDVGIRPNMERMTLIHTMPKEFMYQDLDPKVADELSTTLLEQNIGSFTNPSKDTAWPHLPKVYILTTNDLMMFTSMQEMMVEKAGNWLEVMRIDTGHTPWLAKQEELLQMVGDAVQVITKHNSQK